MSRPVRQWPPLSGVCRRLHDTRFDITTAHGSVIVTSPPACGRTDSNTSLLPHLALGFDPIPVPHVAAPADCVWAVQPCPWSSGERGTAKRETRHHFNDSSVVVTSPPACGWMDSSTSPPPHLVLGFDLHPVRRWPLPAICGRCSPSLARVGSEGLHGTTPYIIVVDGSVVSTSPLDCDRTNFDTSPLSHLVFEFDLRLHPRLPQISFAVHLPTSQQFPPYPLLIYPVQAMAVAAQARITSPMPP